MKMTFVSTWVNQVSCSLAAHACRKTPVKRSGSSHSVNMPIPQPLGSSGVSPIYTPSHMSSSGSRIFINKLFPNLCLQPGPPPG